MAEVLVLPSSAQVPLDWATSSMLLIPLASTSEILIAGSFVVLTLEKYNALASYWTSRYLTANAPFELWEKL